MSEFLLTNEPSLRLACFLAVLLAIAAWELRAPRRSLAVGRLWRWPNNLGLAALNTIILRLVFPTAAVGVALWCQQLGIGLFNALGWNGFLAGAAAIVLLDLTIYFQHRLFHKVPVLWRLHRVHHADLDFDVTTGARFHPLEIGLSMAIKLLVIVVLGPPAAAVLLFEVILNATSMFNHGNVALPRRIDEFIRRLIVTPDMHRVHHSTDQSETDSNFGFNLSCWDRVFGTYIAQPRASHNDMIIGLESFRAPRESRIDRMLYQPWREDAKDDTQGTTRPK